MPAPRQAVATDSHALPQRQPRLRSGIRYGRENPGGEDGYVILIALVLLLAAGGLILFALSPVLRAKVETAAKPWMQWTAESAVADPQSFLNAAEGQTKQLNQQIQARQVSLYNAQVTAAENKADASHEREVGARAIKALKDLYKEAQSNASWPVQWNSRSYSEPELRRQILSIDAEMATQATRKARSEASLVEIAKATEKSKEMAQTANHTLEEIRMARDLIGVRQIDDSLKGKLAEIRGTVAVLGKGADELSGVVSLKTLSADEPKPQQNERFAELMGTP